MGHDQGQAGYWEQDPSAAAAVGGLTDSVTIDPAKNGGERAEVSVKGVTGGKFQLTPGAPGGGTYCDMEIRYAMGRGDSGVYVYAIFSHPASYRAGGVGAESRYITKINQTFDWISVDADRNMLECAPTDWGTGVVVHAKEQRILSKGLTKIPSSTNTVTPACNTNPRLRLVEHQESHRHLVHQPDHRILERRPDQAGIGLPLRRQRQPRPDHPRLLGGRPLRQRRALQHRRRRGLEQGHRPDFCLCQFAGQPQAPTQADLDTLAATAGNPTVPPAGRTTRRPCARTPSPRPKRKLRNGPTTGSTAWITRTKTSAATVTGQIVLNDPLAATDQAPPPDRRPGPSGCTAGGRGGNGSSLGA